MSIHHVYPMAGPAHETAGDGSDCWCEAACTQLCPICGDEDDLKSDCRYCRGHGWTYPKFTDDPDWPTVVIHRLPGQTREVESAHRTE